nr:MAG TPA: hypothetical protein [Caudoviricetes sp.]
MVVATKSKTRRQTVPDVADAELFDDLKRTLPRARQYDRDGNLLWHYVRISEMLSHGGAPTLCGCWMRDDPKHTIYWDSRNGGGLRKPYAPAARSCTGTGLREVCDAGEC